MSDRRLLPTLPLRTWLLASHGLVLLLPVLALVGTGGFWSDLLDQTRTDLRNQGALLALLVEAELEDGARPGDVGASLSPRLARAKTSTLAAVRVVDADGIVVATSGEELGEDLSDRPEVVEALLGHPGEVLRPRPATRASLAGPSRNAGVRLFVAVPVIVDGARVGAVVLSRTPREEVQVLYQIVPWWAALGALVATAGIAWGLGSLATRSLRALSTAAERIADGRGEVEELASPVRSHVEESGALAGALGRLAHQLVRRMAYTGELAANVSHEFRTPIATLRGTVELLRDDEDMPADQRRRFLDNAAATVARMDRLVGGLLLLARAEQADGHDRVALDEVVRAVAGRWAGLGVEGRAGEVVGHRAQLEAVLHNLVENAHVHGGDGVTVRVVGWVEGGRTGFDVVDDGRGISAANLPRVFDRFFSTDRARGTGLGLALVRAIVEAHGGEVAVASRAGETRFRVGLPGA